MDQTSWNDEGNVAVITGGASGIGLAAAQDLAKRGMQVVLVDHDEKALNDAKASFSGGVDVRALSCDVADANAVERLRDRVVNELGPVRFLMNNAGIAHQVGTPWENLAQWKNLLDTNLWGVVHGCQAFVPAMLEAGVPGVVVNTGSKQGITKPPGNYAYNLSKAGVLTYTEALAHAFRQQKNCPLTAHLLVPGFTWTGLVKAHFDEKPDAAWSSEQVAAFLWDSLAEGSFYMLCPDNDVSRDMDEKRVQWTADDIIKDRPALSRWHPDYEGDFAKFMQS